MYNIEILEKILDIMPEYIFYRDLDGKNKYCNESYAKKFIKRDKEYIYGKTYEELDILRQYSNQGRAKDKEVIDGKKTVTYEQTIPNEYNEKSTFEIIKVPSFNEDGDITGILGIMRDIGYKSELDKIKDGFFSNVSHEFRTPINMILSNIQLLEQKHINKDTDTSENCFKKSLGHIYTNTLRLLRLSNNFIELTNAQTGCISFNPKNHDIVSFVEGICDAINNHRDFNGINIVFDTDVEELIVNFDAHKIEKVILNLVSNAIKFNTKDGQVLVSIVSNTNCVKISVKDTGVGIDKVDIEKIFEPFAYVDDSLTKRCEGSGLGLALVKHLVQIHRGSIKVNSEVGKFTEFIISIPNIYNEDEDTDFTYEKIDARNIQSIQTELSDIY